MFHDGIRFNTVNYPKIGNHMLFVISTRGIKTASGSFNHFSLFVSRPHLSEICILY
jgi:hypothetical protein